MFGIPPMTVLAFEAAVPATTDLRPGSSYLTELNSRSEVFRNAGIRSSSEKRFVEWRLAGDAFCNPESGCGGRAMVGYTKFVHNAAFICWIIASLFRHPAATFCGGTWQTLDYIDLFWDSYTAWGDSTDGMVQGSGQHYNGALFNRVISNADSHTGATKSDKARATLDASLRDDFFLSPISCMSGSVSPPSFSFSDVGGNGAFTVSTGSGCPWSAVSSAPWITINSGASGNGLGNVSFTVEGNLSPAARVGTIEVTGLTANLVVTIAQEGIPAASATGSVTISGTAQGDFMDVTTGDCIPWYSDGGCADEGWLTETQWFSDSGQVWITVNGQTKAVWFDEGSTASSIALALAAAMNNDPAFPVRATVIGTTVWMVSRSCQSGNYAFSSGTTYDSDHFAEPSFTTINSAAALIGCP